MAQSTTQSPKNKGSKPAKPRPDFPLFPHRNGQWAKKYRGRTYYFGRWDDPAEALRQFYAEWGYIQEHGCRPTPATTPADSTAEGVTVKDVVNKFLNAKTASVSEGSLSPRTLADYKRACDFIVAEFGKTKAVAELGPEDFSRLRARLRRGRALVSLGNWIVQCRMPFTYAVKAGLIDSCPRFGPDFEKPSKKDLRKHKASQRRKNGRKLFEADEVRTLLDNASEPLRTMILIAVNGGLGQSDLGAIRITDIDLKNGWLNFERVKTGIDRRIPLWPETLQAIKTWIAKNPAAKDPEDEGLLFVTKCGKPWTKTNPKTGTPNDSIGAEFLKVMEATGLRRPRRGFYSLRHTFATLAGGSLDQVAVNAIMGHVDNSMAAEYRERIDDQRLRKVVDHVRRSLDL
ncbi:MAG: hypothetical protein CMJ58_14235 [Planctomycetaceae bacterium]|nr:hypothetical protein [Planctomycetaceae bacterium]